MSDETTINYKIVGLDFEDNNGVFSTVTIHLEESMKSTIGMDTLKFLKEYDYFSVKKSIDWVRNHTNKELIEYLKNNIGQRLIEREKRDEVMKRLIGMEIV